MNDYIKHKEYKLPNGRTVTADFNELGHATITIQAMDALFDILNSSDVVEVVRCRDCKFYTFKPQQTSRTTSVRRCNRSAIICTKPDDYCSFGERTDK